MSVNRESITDLLIKTEPNGKVFYCGGYKNVGEDTAFGQGRKLKWVSDLKQAKSGPHHIGNHDKKVPYGTIYSYIPVKETTEMVNSSLGGVAKITLEIIKDKDL